MCHELIVQIWAAHIPSQDLCLHITKMKGRDYIISKSPPSTKQAAPDSLSPSFNLHDGAGSTGVGGAGGRREGGREGFCQGRIHVGLTILMCTIQWHLVHSPCWAAISSISAQNILRSSLSSALATANCLLSVDLTYSEYLIQMDSSNV